VAGQKVFGPGTHKKVFKNAVGWDRYLPQKKKEKKRREKRKKKKEKKKTRQRRKRRREDKSDPEDRKKNETVLGTGPFGPKKTGWGLRPQKKRRDPRTFDMCGRGDRTQGEA